MEIDDPSEEAFRACGEPFFDLNFPTVEIDDPFRIRLSRNPQA
jgi:hypothetical protein